VSNISDFTANLNGKDYRINLINIPNEKVFNPNISYALADGVPLYIVYPSIKKLIVKYHTKNIIKTKINLKLNGVSIQEIKKK